MTQFNPVTGADRTRTTLDEPRFSTEQCDTLFAAVLADDDIDLNATLPGAIHLDYTSEQLTQCYRICRQLWKDGVGREVLVEIVEKIYRERALSQEEQLLFKHLRARVKHLRFAYVACDERHRYPRVFHWLTAATGYLQDAFKNKQNAAMGRLAIRTRLFLTRPVYGLITREIDQFQPSTTATFQSHVRQQIGFLHLQLAKGKVTSRDFHEMRKAVSQQGALYNNLRILFPSDYHWQVSRYLGTINGLMGNMHDELIARKFDKPQDYYADTFKMPEDIKLRLTTVVASFAAAQIV